MVFVEGKLQSWGRAETVIIILDTEAEQLEDVVDCTLDDLVEAVKNCGDRKRSLAYLKQECGICFSYYPMNKVCYTLWQVFMLTRLGKPMLVSVQEILSSGCATRYGLIFTLAAVFPLMNFYRAIVLMCR